MKRVLIVCGAGASSGFMAGNIRKAAQSRNVDLEITARSDSMIEDYIEDVDLVLAGPHLDYMMDDLIELAKPYEVPIKLIPREAYGKLDGNAVLDFILENL